MTWERGVDIYVEDLVGKTITAVQEDEIYSLTLTTTESEVIKLKAYGECCSESWIENYGDSQILLGQTITAVEINDLPPPKSTGYAEPLVVCAYGYTFCTPKGRYILELRNESNGAYGGFLAATRTNPRRRGPQPRPKEQEGFLRENEKRWETLRKLKENA